MRTHSPLPTLRIAPAAWLTPLVFGLAACGPSDVPTPEALEAPRQSLAINAAPARRDAANRAPEIVEFTFTPAAPAAGEPVRARVRASDPDGDPVTLEYHWTLNGRGLSVNAPEVSITEGRRGDRLSLRVTARDPQGLAATSLTQVALANRAPQLAGLRLDPHGRVRAGRPITVLPYAVDPDGDALRFEYQWRVNGRTVPESGASLSTTALQRGDEVEVTVIANDGRAHSRRLSSPPIALVNAPPEIAHEAVGGPQDGSFRHAIRASDPDGDRLHFSLRSGPRGMQVAPLLGVIEWTPSPNQAGVHPVQIEVDDRHGGTASLSFELTVGDSQAPASPRT